MWKRHLDIFPGEWFGTEHENELKKELEIGDYAKVIVDSLSIPIKMSTFFGNSEHPFPEK